MTQMSDASTKGGLHSRLPRVRRLSLWLILSLSIGHILALYGNRQIGVYLTKVTTMMAIMTVAGVGRDLVSSRYANLILVGLGCSLVGDIFLMLPSDQFLPGLASFLIAHLFYIAGLRTGIKTFGTVLLAVPFYGFGVVAYWILLPGIAQMKIAVLAYLVVILTMAWQAAIRWQARRDENSSLALAGALLFVISDSILAYNRFRSSFYLAPGLIMSTYFSAQYLIALSTHPPMRRDSNSKLTWKRIQLKLEFPPRSPKR